jgi:hypothetical protein
MQQAQIFEAEVSGAQLRANRMLPGHGTGVKAEAVNDDCYCDETRPLWLVVSVLGNVIGGSLLLYGLVLLPQIVAEILA